MTRCYDNFMEEPPQKVTFAISTGSIIRTLLILGIAFMLLYLLDVVLLILTVIVIASAFEPGIKWLVRHNFPRVLATLVIYAIAIVIIVAFFYFVVPPFLADLSKFIVMLPEKITALNLKTGSDLFNWQSAIQGLSHSESIGQAVQNFTTTFSGSSQGVFSTLTAIFGGVVNFLLIIILSFYLCVREDGVEDFLKLITPLKHEPYIVGLWRRTQHKISRWIQGQFILAVIVGFLVYIGLKILGVPNPLFLAFISGAFEIIPVFGPFIGSVPGVLVGFLQGGFPFAIIIALMYLIVQQIESNVIYPLVVQKVLDVPPLVVMIALIVGARLGGFLGVLLSVPIAAALTEYMTDVGKHRTVARAKMSGDVS